MEAQPRPDVVPRNSRRSFQGSINPYKTNKEIVCCFSSVIIKLAGLDKKFPGGHQTFLEKHQGWRNRHIMAIFQRGNALRKVLKDLDKYELANRLDWVHLDETNLTWSRDMFNFKTDAAWLKGRYKKGNLYVRYTGDSGRNH